MRVEPFPGNKKRHWGLAKSFTLSNACIAHLQLSKICRAAVSSPGIIDQKYRKKGVWTLNDEAGIALDDLIAVVPTDAPPRCSRR